MGGGGGFVGVVEAAQGIGDTGLCHRRNGYGTQRFVGGRGLGDERRRAAGELRLSRGASRCRNAFRRRCGETRLAGALASFVGCSNGGRQAMMEAQRFPDDFSGIVSGAPALDFRGDCHAGSRRHPGGLSRQAKPEHPGFLDRRAEVDEAQVVDRCNASESGVKDGLIDDPRSCKVDVAALTGLTGSPAKRAEKSLRRDDRSGRGPLSRPAGRRQGGARWMGRVDRRRWSAAGAAAKPALRVRHTVLQVPGLRQSVVGLHAVRRQRRADPAWTGLKARSLQQITS